jgi:hypothetical protein
MTAPTPSNWPLVKPPSADIDFEFDWSAWLGLYNDTIIGSTWTVVSGAVTVQSSSFTTTSTLVWLTGGLAGYVHLLNTITTEGGRIFPWTLRVKIEGT